MKLAVCSLLLVLLMSLPHVATGQSSGRISGVVKDQMSGSIAGAEIIAVEVERGIERRTTTDQNGSYVLMNLPTGTYRLTISSPGFRTFVQMGLVLQISGELVVNVALQTGPGGGSS